MFLSRFLSKIAVFASGPLLLAGMAGCSPKKETLIVSTASSLTVAMEKLLQLHAAQAPGYQIKLNTGSSGTLAQQILNGAAVDMFLSANQKWIDELDQRDLLLDDGNVTFLGSNLVVIIPGSSLLSSFDDLLRNPEAILAVGAFGSVPVGEYTRVWLEAEGYLPALKNRMVFLKNEQQVLRAVENHHADAGVIYQSSLNKQVRVLLVPDAGKYPPIRYSFAIPAKTRNHQASQNLLHFLQSPEARKIWVESGFQVLDE